MATLNETFQSIADAIRAKGISGTMSPVEMPSKIAAIPTGGSDSRFSALIQRTLTTAEDSTITSIGPYAFMYCTKLTTASFPACTTIGSNAFERCTSLTTASFPFCSLVNASAFRYCQNLTTAYFPNCTSVQAQAFYGCSSLTNATFPKLQYIQNQAFAYAFSIAGISVSFPKASYIYQYAFNGCRNLSEIYFTGLSVPTLQNVNAFANTLITSTAGSIYVPWSLVTTYQNATNWKVFSARFVSIFDSYTTLYYSNGTSASFTTSEFTWAEVGKTTSEETNMSVTSAVGGTNCEIINDQAFYDCQALTQVIFPNCSSIGYSAFQNCLNLTTASFPICESILDFTFACCSNLTTISFPMCSYIGVGAFDQCINLTSMQFNACQYIDNSAFTNCENFVSLYLMGSSVCQLDATTAFDNTPIENGTGSIYVPSSMLTAYQSATNWTYFSSQFVGV